MLHGAPGDATAPLVHGEQLILIARIVELYRAQGARTGSGIAQGHLDLPGGMAIGRHIHGQGTRLVQQFIAAVIAQVNIIGAHGGDGEGVPIGGAGIGRVPGGDEPTLGNQACGGP